MAAGEVRQVAPSIPVASARNALIHAYHVGFSTTLNHLMDIGAVVAFVGAVGAFALVRQRDFVVPTAGPPTAHDSRSRRRHRGRCRRCIEPFTLEGTFVRLEPLSRRTSRVWSRPRPRIAATTSGPTPRTGPSR